VIGQRLNTGYDSPLPGLDLRALSADALHQLGREQGLLVAGAWTKVAAGTERWLMSDYYLPTTAQ
jgi:hypothetical protein